MACIHGKRKSLFSLPGAKTELGSTCEMWGVVKWIDQNGRRIKLVSDEDVQWVPMDAIVEVR